MSSALKKKKNYCLYVSEPEVFDKFTSCDEQKDFLQRGRSLLVVVSSPPTYEYEDFTQKVREYNSREPFNFVTPKLFETNQYQKVRGLG